MAAAVTRLHKLYALYDRIIARVDAEFALAVERSRDHVAPNGKKGLQCGKGCSSCCYQLFNISLLEAAAISRYIKSLPAEAQRRLRDRAIAYQPARRELLATRAAETGLVQIEGKLPVAGLRLACPALEDDACSIYSARPLICRKFGMPIYSPKVPDRLGACELNFDEGEAVEDVDELVRRQTAIHREWEQVQKQVEEITGIDIPGLTVANALLVDYDAILAGAGRMNPDVDNPGEDEARHD